LVCPRGAGLLRVVETFDDSCFASEKLKTAIVAPIRIGRDRIESEEKNRGDRDEPAQGKPASLKESRTRAHRTRGDRDSRDSWYHWRERTAGTDPGGHEAGDKRYLAGQIVVASGSHWRIAARLQDIDGRRGRT